MFLSIHEPLTLGQNSQYRAIARQKVMLTAHLLMHCTRFRLSNIAQENLHYGIFFPKT